MIDINTFIESNSIKKELLQKHIVITNIDEADNYAFEIFSGKRINAVFENSSLKIRCFQKLKSLCSDVNIINCNSCIERFCEDLQKCSDITIFNNINQCRNLDILHLIQNRNNVIIC